MKHTLSFSGGKDSTFLLLELIRRNYPLDEVTYFDTGWEFPSMYEHIAKCKALCEEHGIEFTTLHPIQEFDYWMFNRETKTGRIGYGWCGGVTRWGTELKIRELTKYARKNPNVIQYVGIAFDEKERMKDDPNIKYPLVDWGITEAECLKGCYEAGFDWGGMYEHLDRLSCKFCKNKSLKELRNIRKYYPDVWEELKDYQRRIDRPYRGELTILDIECRFELEDERLAKGLSITNREFHQELKMRLGNEK